MSAEPMHGKACDHHWQFQYIVYRHDTYPMAGTSAKARTYFDRYVCTRCLETRDVNQRSIGDNSYCNPIPGSVPA